MFSRPRKRSPDWGHLHHVVLWVAHVVFLFGAVVGKQLGEEVLCLLVVHLLEIGHPLLIHLAALLLWPRTSSLGSQCSDRFRCRYLAYHTTLSGGFGAVNSNKGEFR